MAVAEKARNELFKSARGTWGEGVAMTLMDYLPPGGWENIATKADIERLRTEDLALLRADMDHGFTRLDGKIDAVAERLDGKVDTVTERLDGKIDTVTERLDGKIDLLSERLVSLDQKVDHLGEQLNNKIDHLGERLDNKVDHFAETLTVRLDETVSRAFADLLARQIRFVIAMLTLLGVVATVVSGLIIARLW